MQVSSVKMKSVESFEWLLDGFFLHHRWDGHVGDAALKGMEVLGYDASSQTYCSRFFDYAGNAPTYQVTVRDNVWTYSGELQRATFEFSDDGNTMTTHWDWGKAVAEHGNGWRLPLPPWREMNKGGELKDLTEKDKKHIEKLATPQPFNAARQKLSLKNKARRKLPKVVILSTFTAAQAKEMIDSGKPLFKELADQNLTFIELPTGHYPMFTRPTELTKIFLDSEST